MREVFDIMDEYIFMIDRNGNIEYINQKLLNKLGYEIEEIYNINLILEDKYINNILNSDKNNKDNLKLITKDSNIVEVSYEISIESDTEKEYIIIIAKDSNIHYSKEDLENILDKAEFLAWIKDINGKYRYANSHYQKYIPKDYKNMLGKNDIEVFGKESDGYFFNNELSLMINNKPKIYEEKRKKSDGSNAYFQNYKYPIIENNKPKYILGYTENITVKKNLEFEIKKNYETISTLYDFFNNDKQIEIYKFIQDMLKQLSTYMAVDSMMMLIYDEKKKVLQPKALIGESEKFYKHSDNIDVNIDLLKKYLSNPKNEGIRHKSKFGKYEYEKYARIYNANYKGTYNITLADEFIGVISICYIDKNIPINEVNKFMKTICIEVGMMIKNHKLYEDINKELLKSKEVEESINIFLELATDIMGIFSKDGKVLKLGDKCEESLGWTIEDINNINILEIIHPDDLDTILEFKSSLLKDELLSATARCLCKDGQYKWLNFRGIYNKKNQRYIMTAKDITYDMKLEEEKKCLEEAVYLESIKNEFFANISHEFKTPINIILGIMQLLDSKVKNKEIYSESDIDIEKCIQSIKQNSYRLLRLVNNLIDMTRIDTGYYEIELGNYNIVSIIEDTIMSVVDYIKGTNKDIDIIFDTDIEELVVACDPVKIERIILNLLSNAIKYTDKDGEIIVYIKYEQNNIIVYVKDNGVGISKEKIKLIFEGFGQANDSLTRPCEGSGIGLSLVKALVELHDGSIGVKSEENVGSEFFFTIPNKIIENQSEKLIDEKYKEFNKEKCDIEFSDIYV